MSATEKVSLERVYERTIERVCTRIFSQQVVICIACLCAEIQTHSVPV